MSESLADLVAGFQNAKVEAKNYFEPTSDATFVVHEVKRTQNQDEDEVAVFKFLCEKAEPLSGEDPPNTVGDYVTRIFNFGGPKWRRRLNYEEVVKLLAALNPAVPTMTAEEQAQYLETVADESQPLKGTAVDVRVEVKLDKDGGPKLSKKGNKILLAEYRVADQKGKAERLAKMDVA